MRFLHKHPGGKVTAIPGEDDLFTNRPKKSPEVASFKVGLLFPWEIAAAKSTFHFRGQTAWGSPGNVGELVDPSGRIAYYDTVEQQKQNGWTDEYRQRVEQGLLNNKFLGSDFILVERPELPKPWPKYDELVAHGRRTVVMVAEQIKETVDSLGLDTESVVAYEETHLNRPEVINALRGVKEDDGEAVVVAA